MAKPITYCTIGDCTERCTGHGMCALHYSRWYKNGDPLVVKREFRITDRQCGVTDCPNPKLAKGLCGNHYALNRRNGAPVIVRKFVGVYIKDGYRYVWVSKRNYQPEHRLVMEKALGRKLKPSEHVHHRNHDTLDNRRRNLVVLSRSEHLKAHLHGRRRGARGHYVAH